MDNNIWELDMILHNKKYSYIYSYTGILLLTLILFTYILICYDYHTYYKSKGIINNQNLLEIYVYDSEISIISEKDIIEIENIKYKYQIAYIDDEVYLSNDYKNYQKAYLKVNNLNYRENQVLEFKIEKKNEKIIYHILDYLERR